MKSYITLYKVDDIAIVIMNFIVSLLFLSKCYFCLTASVKVQHLGQERLVGGHESKPNSHPYLVSLQMRFLWIRMHFCGGSILNEQWVLTAAHCVQESFLIRWLPLDAVAGAHDVNTYGSNAQIRTITKRYPHPLYPGGIAPYDIAVLRTNTPFTFTNEIQPVNLPYNYEVRNESLILAGWGVLKTTYFIPDLPDRLQEVEVTYVPYKECYEAIDEVKDIDESNTLDEGANICTGPLSGGIAACSGDSGGPLVQYTSIIDDDYEENYDYNTSEQEFNNREHKMANFDDTDKVPIVVGIVSWGMAPCGYRGAPTVYTKVSKYIDFINEYTKL